MDVLSEAQEFSPYAFDVSLCFTLRTSEERVIGLGEPRPGSAA